LIILSKGKGIVDGGDDVGLKKSRRMITENK
jgi:hypothetical protein